MLAGFGGGPLWKRHVQTGRHDAAPPTCRLEAALLQNPHGLQQSMRSGGRGAMRGFAQ